MRLVGSCVFSLCLATGLSAQIRSATPVVTGTVGSVVHPAGAAGTGGITRTAPSVVNPGGGGVHLVVPGQTRKPAGALRSTGIFTYPVYMGGYYDSSYITPQDYIAPSGSAVQPNVTVVMPPQTQQAPIVINNFYPGSTVPAADGGRVQTVPQSDESDTPAEPAHYFIALTDHTIYAASAYFVDGDTLHYFTSGNTHNQVSLALVDRPFTARLNKEAGVAVQLPAPK